MFTMRSCALWLMTISLMSLPALAADAPGDLFGRLKAKVKDDQPFQLLIQIKLKPGTEQKFAAEATKAAKETAREPGCEMYSFFDDLEQPGTVIVFEKWKSVAALKSHLEQPYTQSLLKLLGELKVEPEIRLLSSLPAPKTAP
jgi:quinol monooxygenase YgiN